MSTLSDQLLYAGLISTEKHAEHTNHERTNEEKGSQYQLALMQVEQVENLSKILRQVTMLRRFRKTALSLLSLRPESVDLVAMLAARLPKQDGSEKLLEEVTHLEEWLPSLPTREQEALVQQTLQ